MNIHDRLRDELDRRSAGVAVQPTDAHRVMEAARARNRRTRIIGGAAITALFVAAGATALVLRDGSEPNQVATSPARNDDGTDDAVDPAAEDASATGDDSRRSAQLDGEDEIATTEPDGASGESVEPEPGAADGTEADVEADPAEPADEQPARPHDDRFVVDELVPHGNGFIAVASNGELVFSTDGARWQTVADAKPTRRSTITHITSHGGTLYVAGDRPEGDATQPWMAASDDLRSWQAIGVPTPDDGPSSLTITSTHIHSVAAGPAGVIVSGETIVDLRVEELLEPEVIASGAWSLGDATGDLSKLLVYDADGNVRQEIDLVAAGVPPEIIDAWTTAPARAFVASGTLGGPLEQRRPDLPTGTIVTHVVAGDDGFTGSGFSARFSSNIVWASPDGDTWEPTPVGVVNNPDADVVGMVQGRVTVFASQGPLLTVQQQRGDQWREVRLDELFGNANDEYFLLDAAFHDSGAAAVVATVGQAGTRTLWLTTSANGLDWVAEPLSASLGGDSVTEVRALAVSGGAVALAGTTAGGEVRTHVVDR